jgi:hypothetical protein
VQRLQQRKEILPVSRVFSDLFREMQAGGGVHCRQ